jgi:hypothetical protein
MADIYGCSARILVNGRKVREYERDGDRSLFVESKHNSEYEIHLQNHLGTKVLAVVSVDGLDVVSGMPASNDSPGYILKPHSSIKIRGFRKDDNTVGSFKFVTKKTSYASSKEKGGNEGVISIRFFNERKKLLVEHLNDKRWPVSDIWRCLPHHQPPQHQYVTTTNCSNSVGYSAVVTPHHQTPFHSGTTWGSKKDDKVSTVSFDRGNFHGEIVFYYTTKSGLQSMGIQTSQEKYVSYPQPFVDSDIKYATPPKGWE